MNTTTAPTPTPTSKLIFSKVPEVTIYFWIIKVLCTTVGESAADFLNVNLNLGLTGTSVVTGALLLVALAFQFSADRYIPGRYWLTVALVSVFGTLVTDNLTDKIGVPLTTSTLLFGGLLAATFTVWYLSEKSLSIHSIFTRKREAFYWAAILFTFALGTATGDLVAEELGVGYLMTGVLVASLIALTAVAWKLGLNSILAFWIGYILTRPLGASVGDYLSQPATYGGLGLGAMVTSAIFTVGILATVTYLSLTKTDAISAAEASHETPERGGLWQTIAVVSLFVVVGGAAYQLRTASLESDISDSVAAASTTDGAPPSPLGDLTTFKAISQDTLTILNNGDQSGATSRVADLEHEWDTSQAKLKPRDKAVWNQLDGEIDTVLRELRAVNPDPTSERSALNALIVSLS